jgi:putative peptide zinc metalloprotease protein
MGATEGRVLRALDGMTAPAEIVRRLAADGVRISIATVETFVRVCSRRGLLENTAAERFVLQLERLRAERNRSRSLFRGDLLRMRWSFGDPNALFDRTLRSLRWCFTRQFVIGSIVLWLAAVWAAVDQSSRLHAEVGALLLPANLTLGRTLLIWLIFLGIAVVHELGHGYTCKRFGGEVHEIGFMLVYLQPAFYCNVSDAWSFPDLRARLWVTAAGGWIELVVAASATLVWCFVQPGSPLSEPALIVTVLAGGLGLLTNANPLLPFDGYFALSDWLGIPNLRQRGLAYWGWWLRRHVLHLDTPEPAATPDEQRILLRYGSIAAVYIAFALAATLYYIGAWSWRTFGGLGLLASAIGSVFLFRSMLRSWGAALRDAAMQSAAWLARRLRGRRGRGVWATLILIVLVSIVLPWPITTGGSMTAVSATSATAVVATESGVVSAVLVREGDRVVAGDPVLLLAEPGVLRERESLARVAETQSADQRAAQVRGDAAAKEIAAAGQRLTLVRAASADDRLARGVVRARSAGTIVTPHTERLLGQRLVSGATAVEIADADSVELHISLGGAGAVLARSGMQVRLLSYADAAHPIVASVSSVAALGDTADASGRLEARVRVVRNAAWRPGVTGEGRIVLRQSTLFGAAWWRVRSWVRTDLLL